VQGITDLITTPGLINLDFADVKSVMQGAGSALMGIGSARGADRAIKAAELAVESPLLEASIEGAHGVLLSVQGGSNLGIFEINDAAQLVKEAAHPEANIIFGTVIDETMGDEIRITVIATGFEQGGKKRQGTANVSHLSSYRQREDLSTPAFMRKDKAPLATQAVIKMGAGDDEEDSNLEIPTFLRRQAD
jgi:cell division protein FtsZ